MKIQDLRIRLTETYFEDLPDEERIRLRSQNQAELRRLSKRDYPFKLKDGTEVLGPVIRFEPYKSDAGRDETWKDANQQMVERPNGDRAIMFAVGLGLITKTPPRKPLNWPGMLGLKEIATAALDATPDVQEWEGKNLAWTDGHFFWITVNKPHDASYIAAWNKDNKQIGRLSTSEIASGQKGKWLSISDVSIKEEALGQRLATMMYKVLLQHMGKQYDGLLGYKPDIVDKRIHRIYKRLGARDYPDWYTVPNPNKPGAVNEQQYLTETTQDLGEFHTYGSTNGYVVDTANENDYRYWMRIYGRDPRVQEFIQTVKRFAILDSIEVQKDARGMGYGNQLIKSFISDAKAAGAEAIIAAVNKTEIQAKGFDLIEWYQKLGFKMMSDNRGNVSVMALRLI